MRTYKRIIDIKQKDWGIVIMLTSHFSKQIGYKNAVVLLILC